VGAVGYTLGGGLGWLARKYGPACDTVRSFEVVTPDGRLLRASADERTELFRALRGSGGGAIAIVTEMEIDLVAIDRVYAGNLFFPAHAAAEVTSAYARWAQHAPDDLTTSIVYMNYPPLPEVPEPLRGRSFTIVRGCWAGEIEAGRTFVDRLRAEVTPALDTWEEMSFADMASISSDPVDPMPCITTGGWLTGLDDEAGTLVADATFPVAGPPLLAFTELRHLGGAVASRDRSLSAMGNRDGRFTLHAIGVPMAPGHDAAIAEHLERAPLRRRVSGLMARRRRVRHRGERGLGDTTECASQRPAPGATGQSNSAASALAVSHREALEHDRDLSMELESEPSVRAGEEPRVRVEPRRQRPVAFSFIERELLVDGRQRADSDLGHLQQRAGAHRAVGHDGEIADRWQGLIRCVVVGHRSGSGTLRSAHDEFDQLVGQLHGVTEAPHRRLHDGELRGVRSATGPEGADVVGIWCPQRCDVDLVSLAAH
jgi:hypothetical protein